VRQRTDEQNLDPEKTVARFVEKIQTDSRFAGDNYIHEELEINDTLKNGVVAEREKKLFAVRVEKGTTYSKLMSRDGTPMLNPKFEPKKEPFSVNAQLFQRYIFTFVRNENFERKRCWVLSFKPRGNLPEEKPEDRVLNNLAGEIWIVQDTFSLAKLVFSLTKGVNFAWPSIIGGRITMVDGVVIGGAADGHFVISSVRVEYEYSARLIFWPKNKRAIKTIYYQNYERRDYR